MIGAPVLEARDGRSDGNSGEGFPKEGPMRTLSAIGVAAVLAAVPAPTVMAQDAADDGVARIQPAVMRTGEAAQIQKTRWYGRGYGYRGYRGYGYRGYGYRGWGRGYYGRGYYGRGYYGRGYWGGYRGYYGYPYGYSPYYYGAYGAYPYAYYGYGCGPVWDPYLGQYITSC